MAFPLTTVLSAAPGIISAAADIIRMLRDRKKPQIEPPAQQEESTRIDELVGLIEKQALVIEELAVNNRNLALAVRNNRIVALSSLVSAVIAILLAILL